LAVLWGLRLLVEGRLSWKQCPVALCLAALFLTGAAQLVPLDRPVLGRLAPGTARLYEELLPARPEVLPFGEQRAPPRPPAGSTLSVSPAARRQELVRFLAVLLLFVIVRNNCASPAALRRLCVVALVNGALLALFALVQFFTSAPHLLYWTIRTEGIGF